MSSRLDYEARVRAASAELPKVELHIHLDGSLSPSFIARRAAARGIPLPCESPEDIRASLVSKKLADITSGTHVQSEGGNWSGFDWCNQFLQTEDELREAAFELFDFLHRCHNVWVAEVRFCPALHTAEGLSEDAAVASVVAGFRQAQRTHLQLRGGIILCALRSMPVSHFESTFSLARAWLGKGVVGGDVAGDEASYPLEPFINAIQHAVEQLKLPMTVHAGEWVPSGESNLMLALERGKVKRIGHALILGDSVSALQAVANRRVAVEVCLTSNIGGGEFKCPSYEAHPICKLLDGGVSVAGFNSDNLLLSGTLDAVPSPTNEIVRAVLDCGLRIDEHIPNVLQCALEFSFDPRVNNNVDPKDKGYSERFSNEINLVLRKYDLIKE